MDQPASASIREHFATLTDPRSDHCTQHYLLNIITIALCGVICGAESWTEIEQFGHAKLPWLRTFLDLPNGIPAHDTFGRVCAARARSSRSTAANSTVVAVRSSSSRASCRLIDAADHPCPPRLAGACCTSGYLIYPDGETEAASGSLRANGAAV